MKILRNCHGKYKSKEIWTFNVICPSGWGPGTV